MKVVVGLIVFLGVLVGMAYGLAKIGVLPVKQLAARNKAAALILSAVGLNVGSKPAALSAAGARRDPLAGEKQVLAAQRAALDKEKVALETQSQAGLQAADASRAAARASEPDPKQLSRMAAVYEEMSAPAVTKIFAKLPDSQVVAMMRRMDEKQVGQILASVAPDRAARLTLSLSLPDPTQRPVAAVN